MAVRFYPTVIFYYSPGLLFLIVAPLERDNNRAFRHKTPSRPRLSVPPVPVEQRAGPAIYKGGMSVEFRQIPLSFESIGYQGCRLGVSRLQNNHGLSYDVLLTNRKAARVRERSICGLHPLATGSLFIETPRVSRKTNAPRC